MTTMRRFMAALAWICMSLSACWFTEDNFDSNYIYGVNAVYHYIPVPGGTYADATYRNGQSSAVALTPYVKISPRTADQPRDAGRDLSIKCCIFRYRVFSASDMPKGPWTTVGYYMAKAGTLPGWTQESVDLMRASLPEPYRTQIVPTYTSWEMDWSAPVALFGKSAINPKTNSGLYDGSSLQAGDIILMEYYISDGLFETGDLESDIYPQDVRATEMLSNWTAGRRTFPPQFIFKVIYNGKKRIGR